MQMKYPFIKIDRRNITNKEKEKMKETKFGNLRNFMFKEFNI